MLSKWRKLDYDIRVVIVGIVGVGLAVLLSILLGQIGTGYGMEILLLGVLVLVTMLYATHTKRMVNEMREERVMASRPILIQKAVHKAIHPKSRAASALVIHSGYFSHFEIYNAGNGPAIEVEVALMDKERTWKYAIRETVLRAGEAPIKLHAFELTMLLEESTTYYLVCEYQGIFSRVGKETWYQTWLPFKAGKASKKGEVYVTAGELEFKEVTEKDRIDTFISRSKPK